MDIKKEYLRLTSETIPRFLSLTYFLTDNLKEVEIILED
jgi:hypothetical protein